MQQEEIFSMSFIQLGIPYSVTTIPTKICSIAWPDKLFINQYKYNTCLNCVILPQVLPGFGARVLHLSISSFVLLPCFPTSIPSQYASVASMLSFFIDFRPLGGSNMLLLLSFLRFRPLLECTHPLTERGVAYFPEQ